MNFDRQLLYEMGFEDCPNPDYMSLYLRETDVSVLITKTQSYSLKEIIGLIDKQCANKMETALFEERANEEL
jgi:hypothetical protein